MHPDPWRTAIDVLSAHRPYRPLCQFGDHWRPADTQNPRHSRAPYFTEQEAMDMVKKCLKEVLGHRAKTGRGYPPNVRIREETYMKDPSRRAYILLIEGKAHPRPVYVKWVFLPSEQHRESIHFISFHQSDEAESP